MLKLVWSKIPTLEQGFTLVELMVVVVILGVLSGLAIPVYNSVVSNAQEAADKATIGVLQSAVNLYGLENGTAPNSFPTSTTTYDHLVDGGFPAGFSVSTSGEVTKAP